MSRTIARRVGRSSAIIVAAAVLLGGCQIVSRVVGQDPIAPSPVATCVLLEVAAPTDGTDPAEVLAASSKVIQQRLLALDLPYVEAVTLEPATLSIGLPLGDQARWRGVIEQTGDIAFVAVPPEFDPQLVDGQPLPEGMDGTPILDGSAITSASRSEDQLGAPAIALDLTPEAAAAFDAHAGAHFGERFAIVVDGVVVSSPSINATRFNGHAEISGAFTPEQAQDLLAVLSGGRLPTSVTEVAVGEPVDGECPLRTATP